MSIHTDTLLRNSWKSFSEPLLAGLTDAEVDVLEEDWGVHFFWEKAEDGTNTLKVLGFINGFLQDKHALLEGRFCDPERIITDFTVLIDLGCGEAIHGEDVGSVSFLPDPETKRVRLTAAPRKQD